MSKNPDWDGDGDLPPSYNEATAPAPPSSSSAFHPGSSVSATLTDLSSLLRETQAQQTARDTVTVTTLLPLLTPHLTSLLTRLGTTPHPPALAELYLVPGAAVGPEWSIASDADRRAGESVHVVRVEREADPELKGAGDSKRASSGAGAASAAGPSSSYEFDEWGRWDDGPDAASAPKAGEWWWWNDELLAHRLARRLQPEPKLDRTVVRAAVEQAKEEKKAGRWGLFKSGGEPSSSSSSSASAPPPRLFSKSAPARPEEDVSMTVRAEEVTFRRENEMGIWESMRGYGIVARVRIRKP
ncbi:hypothetical protein EsH8_II_000468 [Colletotrichum jinshuiense]